MQKQERRLSGLASTPFPTPNPGGGVMSMSLSRVFVSEIIVIVSASADSRGRNAFVGVSWSRGRVPPTLNILYKVCSVVSVLVVLQLSGVAVFSILGAEKLISSPLRTNYLDAKGVEMEILVSSSLWDRRCFG